MNSDIPVQVSQSPDSFPLSGLRIRPMRIADIEQVIAIDQASFSLPWPKNAYAYEINDNPHSLALVAENVPESGEPRIAGMIVVWLILDEAHIATIAVDHPYRRQGVAQLLIVEAMQKMIPRGAQVATLEVRVSNEAARRLYEKFGFEVAGRRIRYYQDNHEDALIMTVSDVQDVDWQQYLTKIEQTETKDIRSNSFSTPESQSEE